MNVSLVKMLLSNLQPGKRAEPTYLEQAHRSVEPLPFLIFANAVGNMVHICFSSPQHALPAELVCLISRLLFISTAKLSPVQWGALNHVLDKGGTHSISVAFNIQSIISTTAYDVKHSKQPKFFHRHLSVTPLTWIFIGVSISPFTEGVKYRNSKTWAVVVYCRGKILRWTTWVLSSSSKLFLVLSRVRPCYATSKHDLLTVFGIVLSAVVDGKQLHKYQP